MGDDSVHPTLGQGKICYIGIPSNDIERSADFYYKVFSWNIRTRDDGTTTFDDGVGEVSGQWHIGQPSPSETGLQMYIMVDDALKTVDDIVANGGDILQAIDFDAPRITALFADPSGNVFGIFQHQAPLRISSTQ